MLRSLWFRTLVLGPAGGGGDLVTPRCSAARSRSDRWAVEGTERQRWWRGGSGWSGRVDSWRSAAVERIHLAGSAVVHRALAVEPSVYSDPGRAAERKLGGVFWPR